MNLQSSIRCIALLPALFLVTIFLVTIFLVTLFPSAALADDDDIVVRQLSLDTEGIRRLHIKSGAGDLVIKGAPATNEIAVGITIDVSPAYNGDDPESFVTQFVTLSLERHGRSATLTAGISLGVGISNSPEIDLEIAVPPDLEIEIVDEAGAVRISGINAEVTVDNGPGHIQITDIAAELSIVDTSGRIVVENISSDVQINDRSGSITVRDIDGTVFVTDSSGHINAEGISQDLVIEQDTSGNVNAQNIGGKVLRPQE